MTILITGGFGYIGGRLAQYLGHIYGDANIRLLVRNDSYVPEWVGEKQIVTGDLLDISSLELACEDVDTVIHLAALNEIDSAKDPLAALRVNGEGTLNLINAAILNNVKKIIYFSTFHVYGLNASGNITENTVPLPVHPYAITHHVSEDFIRMADNKKDIEGIILRLSNGFGYPANPQVNRWSLVVNDLCLQAVLNNKMVLKSSGKQHRDFVTLTDVSRCVEHLLSIDSQKLNAADCIYNLGGEFSCSILDMAELIKERCEKTLGITPEITVVKDNMPNNAVAKPVIYSIDKIKKTGFELAANVNEEIDKTIIFCDKYKDLLK
ncbi:MAG: NAD(P)-dependent oxidoreductase [Methanosarcinales archaeon]|nr:NAD(P)-dependent oxidoreductase [Methanosarcinales archaeon]